MSKKLPDLFSVKDKVVIITGCARGIGLTYARGLGAHGAKLAICDIQDEKIREVGQELEKSGCEVLTSRVDVTDPGDISDFIQQVLKKYGRIDGLVNNAGVLMRRTPEEMTLEEWELIQKVNVNGTFLFAQAVGLEMIRKREGSIVNIASIAARQALDLRIAYCTSKAAVQHFTRTLAFEWGKYNIRVNAIAPGFIKSDMNADLRANEEIYNRMVSEVPLARFGEPDDLLGTLMYLLSSASTYVTGQTIFVDGGKTTV
jgi:NAD(P)-dependent dehydrogenase (short-subunit alcohol dehydrogenase family)